MNEVKWELMQGLPPPASPGFFVGFDRWLSPCILEWDDRRLAWVALGFNCRKMDASYALHPHFFVEIRCDGDQANYIKAHAVLFDGKTEINVDFAKAVGIIPPGGVDAVVEAAREHQAAQPASLGEV